jgi:hypothetical protein
MCAEGNEQVIVVDIRNNLIKFVLREALFLLNEYSKFVKTDTSISYFSSLRSEYVFVELSMLGNVKNWRCAWALQAKVFIDIFWVLKSERVQKVNNRIIRGKKPVQPNRDCFLIMNDHALVDQCC